MRCPECSSYMEEGVLPVSHGMHWLKRKDDDHADFAEDVPGTHSVMRANRLDAWRCKRCELILFRYGHRHTHNMARVASRQQGEQDETAD